LAAEVRELMCAWMVCRGVTATLGVSPYVDRTGRASVLIRVDARLIHAMLLTLPDERIPPRGANGSFRGSR
jgi:hypothetical protein